MGLWGAFKDFAGENLTQQLRQGLNPVLLEFVDAALLLIDEGELDADNVEVLCDLSGYNYDLLIDVTRMPPGAISFDTQVEQSLRRYAKSAAAIALTGSGRTTRKREKSGAGATSHGPDFKTWGDFDGLVRDWAEQASTGSAFVLEFGKRGAYVQCRREEGRFLVEASNDKSHGGSATLTVQEYKGLLALGWRQPLADADYPNLWYSIDFGRLGPAERNFDELRIVLKKTLMDGFGVLDARKIRSK
ncbi:MAG: hypothetical protein NVV57_00290 [Demequina sp.]|nr:hypothetical protein [Demequina sp.]